MARRSRSEPKYGLVVFDLDGTLVDSAADLCASVNSALRAHGLSELPEPEVRRFVGHGARQLIVRSIEAASAVARETVVEEVFAAFLRHYAEHCLDRTRLYPGVDAALAALRRSARLAVLTNKPGAFADQILAGLGIRGLFDGLVGGDDPSTRKPAPQGLLALMAAAGGRAEETVLVGDSPVDVETARNAGVDSCAITWGFAPTAELVRASPTRIARQPADLPALLG